MINVVLLRKILIGFMAINICYLFFINKAFSEEATTSISEKDLSKEAGSNFQIQSLINDKMSLRVGLINTLMAAPQLEIDYKVSNSLLIGPEFIWHSRTEEDKEFSSKRGPITYSFRRDEIGFYATQFIGADVYSDSWILNSGLAYARSSIRDNRGNKSEGDIGLLKSLGGYHWQWKNRLNLELLAGVVFGFGMNKLRTNGLEVADKVEPVSLDLKIAWGYLF